MLSSLLLMGVKDFFCQSRSRQILLDVTYMKFLPCFSSVLTLFCLGFLGVPGPGGGGGEGGLQKSLSINLKVLMRFS